MDKGLCLDFVEFQHTAARRRLGPAGGGSAGRRAGFNTQPPEGGWSFGLKMVVGFSGFNTQPPEGGWLPPDFNGRTKEGFQHTAA